MKVEQDDGEQGRFQTVFILCTEDPVAYLTNRFGCFVFYKTTESMRASNSLNFTTVLLGV